MFKGIFSTCAFLKTHRHAAYQCLKKPPTCFRHARFFKTRVSTRACPFFKSEVWKRGWQEGVGDQQHPKFSKIVPQDCVLLLIGVGIGERVFIFQEKHSEAQINPIVHISRLWPFLCLRDSEALPSNSEPGTCNPFPKNLFGLFLTFRDISLFCKAIFGDPQRKDPLKQA